MTPQITLPELLRMMRLLSATESAILVTEKRLPDHLVEEIDWAIGGLEAQIVARSQ